MPKHLVVDEPLEVSLHDFEVQVGLIDDLGLLGASPRHLEDVCHDV